MADSDTLRVGDRAPDFDLPTQDGGKRVKLSDYRGKKAVVLYFYPKDFTPGCTMESCAFRDAYEDFVAAGAEVIGVSDDDVTSHEEFARHHRLPFVLASDEGGRVREKYGVKTALWVVKGRVTFVIDREGIVRNVFDSKINMERHVTESLAVLKRAVSE
jgi:peroxiredoxin Q/BCP